MKCDYCGGKGAKPRVCDLRHEHFICDDCFFNVVRERPLLFNVDLGNAPVKK